jgi:hypothetical protein
MPDEYEGAPSVERHPVGEKQLHWRAVDDLASGPVDLETCDAQASSLRWRLRRGRRLSGRGGRHVHPVPYPAKHVGGGRRGRRRFQRLIRLDVVNHVAGWLALAARTTDGRPRLDHERGQRFIRGGRAFPRQLPRPAACSARCRSAASVSLSAASWAMVSIPWSWLSRTHITSPMPRICLSSPCRMTASSDRRPDMGLTPGRYGAVIARIRSSNTELALAALLAVKWSSVTTR